MRPLSAGPAGGGSSAVAVRSPGIRNLFSAEARSGLPDLRSTLGAELFYESWSTMTDDAQPETPRALAAALNLSPESLRLYRKLKGAPEGWNVEEWRGFVDGLGLARAGNATLNELKAELLREQIHLARAKNRREGEAVVDRETVREMLGLLGQKLDLLLRLKLEVELPSRCLGKNAAEIGIEGAAILDEIREVVNGNLARFETDAVKASAGP